MDACKEVYDIGDFELYGSGRTDSGVHALGQVAHLDIKSAMPPHVARIRLNEKLPASINILSMEKANPKFHARYDAVARSYLYHISRRRTAFGKDYSWWIKDTLNVNAMADLSPLFEGMKNYQSFGQNEKEDESTLVEVIAVKLFEVDDSVLIQIVGSHFLWRMVRRMVGIMAEVGRGRFTEKDVAGFFREYSEIPAQFTAPPSGLYLERVYYAGEEISFEPRFLMNI